MPPAAAAPGAGARDGPESLGAVNRGAKVNPRSPPNVKSGIGGTGNRDRGVCLRLGAHSLRSDYDSKFDADFKFRFSPAGG
jgi:hypothetical protein